jgi:hypothetical protein
MVIVNDLIRWDSIIYNKDGDGWGATRVSGFMMFYARSPALMVNST